MFPNFISKSSFQKKYKVLNYKKLIKILDNQKKIDNWQIIDIRTFIEFKEAHIQNSISIPAVSNKYKIFKKVNRSKKIIIINNNYRSNLSVYNLLFSKNIKVYLFIGDFKKDILENHNFEKYLFKSASK